MSHISEIQQSSGGEATPKPDHPAMCDLVAGSASERVKYWDDRFHAALRPDGLRAIADGIAHPNSNFTLDSVQECLRVAADKIETLESERDEARRIAGEYRRVWELISTAVDETPNTDPLPWL